MCVIAAIVAAPFTSLWVPIIVVSFFLGLIIVLVVWNFLFAKRRDRLFYKAFAQIYSAVSWAADHLRFP